MSDTLTRLARAVEEAADLHTYGEGWDFGDAIPACANWPDVVRAVLAGLRDNEDAAEAIANLTALEGMPVWHAALDAITKGE